MRFLRTLGVGTAVVAFAVSCSDSTAPTTTLTDAEKATLAAVLAGTDSYFAEFAGVVVQLIDEVGTLDAGTVNAAAVNQAINTAVRMSASSIAGTSYEGAVGLAIEVTDIGWVYGVVGWNGINTGSNTVDEIVAVAGYGLGTLPATVSGTVGDGVEAVYMTPTALYVGASGTASVTGSSFSGSGANCSGQGYTCSYVTGTMNGNFGFTAYESVNQYVQAPVHFSSLPALKVTLTATTH